MEYRFNPGEVLGKGAFGTVFKGVRLSDGLEVAIKRIPKTSINRRLARAIEAEVDALKQLDHPNIIKFYYFSEELNHFQICMELLTGQELLTRICSKSSYTEKEARDACKAILSAIHHCHERDIVHCDIKPENLMLRSPTDDSDIVIVDFGLAEIAPDLTILGQKGSTSYMAPEILNDVPYGKPVDMWAFGVIVFILLSGSPPFYGDTTNQLERRIQKRIFKFHDAQWQQISAEAKDFISNLLWLDVSERLTVQKALLHPWLQCTKEQLQAHNLSQTLVTLHRFNARRKLRAVLQTVLVMARWRRYLAASSITKSSSQPPLPPPPPLPQTGSMRSASALARQDSGPPPASDVAQALMASPQPPEDADDNKGKSELVRRLTVLARENSVVAAVAMVMEQDSAGNPELVRRLSVLARENSVAPAVPIAVDVDSLSGDQSELVRRLSKLARENSVASAEPVASLYTDCSSKTVSENTVSFAPELGTAAGHGPLTSSDVGESELDQRRSFLKRGRESSLPLLQHTRDSTRSGPTEGESQAMMQQLSALALGSSDSVSLEPTSNSKDSATLAIYAAAAANRKTSKTICFDASLFQQLTNTNMSLEAEAVSLDEKIRGLQVQALISEELAQQHSSEITRLTAIVNGLRLAIDSNNRTLTILRPQQSI